MRTTSESLNVVKGTSSVIKDYLNTESKFYTAICGYSISRAAVVLVNLIATLMIVAAMAAEQAPILTLICVTASAFLVRVLNSRKEAHDGNE